MKVASIALFVHTDRPAVGEQANALIDRLVADGHDVRLPFGSAEMLGCPERGCREDQIGEGLDLAISLGGDGSMLRAVAAVADYGVPVLGVNHGSLGYLTDVLPEGASEAVDGFLAGDHTIEERTRLDCRLDSGSKGRALNEVIVEKVDSGRTVKLAVRIDGEYFTSYAADGLIAATPTGSTAYSLSAGGPIVSPSMAAMVLTPVAPHMPFDRSLVLPPESALTIEVLSDRPAAVAVDGHPLGTLEVGGHLTCTVSDKPARLVALGGRGFHQTLKSAFGLPE